MQMKTIYVLSILLLFLAISISITIPKTKSHKPTLSPRSTLFHRLLRFLGPPPPPQPTATVPTSPYCVLWMAPFLTGGGYSSEAWSYILALQEFWKTNHPRFKLSIEQHGDLQNPEFWEGLPQETRDLAVQLHATECRFNETIVVCHSEPGAWRPPLFQTLPCPPARYGHFKVVIGRTMFESDRVGLTHVERCNKMDFIWVPTEFHVRTFVESGVDSSKVVKIVQPVDSEFFDPRKYEPLDLDLGKFLVLGQETEEMKLIKRFVFLSIFKWEFRKGWDVLLRAYLNEFSGHDNVALLMLTNPYHSEDDFNDKIVEFVEDSELEEPANGWPNVYVLDHHVPQVVLPRLYKAADAFVLPSRGEGWGRPVVEAMAMELPVIATNWSGLTEYLTEENGYPLGVDRMSEVVEGPFEGHLWAEPSVEKLQVLMRHVMANVDEARDKGKQAREDMIKKFSPKKVAQILVDNVHDIIDTMA